MERLKETEEAACHKGMEQVKEPVKEEREHVLAIACRVMTGVSPVTAAANSQTWTPQPPFPTPSPFSFSGNSTRWSSRPFIQQYSHLLLRFLVLFFSFISALMLAATSTKKKDQQSHTQSFADHPELIYCFIVAILAFLYAAFQLFKGICDIAHTGILISEKTSDYLGFVIDQLVGYLLISSASIAIPIIPQVEKNTPLRKGIIVSTSMSFATFLVIAVCALLSGHRLCKRIVW